MGVIAKFKVDEIHRRSWGPGQEIQTIVATPVTSGSEENQSFWKATPSGKLELGCINPAAAEQFTLGGEFYLEFRFPE
jgi:hypothetical protein